MANEGAGGRITQGFTEGLAQKIGRITPQGQITEFSVPLSGSYFGSLCAGPDGNLWLTDKANRIIRMTTAGLIIGEFAIPTPESRPAAITIGPDNNLWFIEYSGNKIGQITTGQARQPATTSVLTSPAGTVQEFLIPTPKSSSEAIIGGPDGNVWFAEKDGNKIGLITPQGHITEFSIPTSDSGASGIVLGSDGNLWFHEYKRNQIGRITPQGRIDEFPVTSGSNLVGIAAGPDGNIWFTEFNFNKIGRMNTSGAVIGEFSLPTGKSGPGAITGGSDGNVWFAEDLKNKIGCITPQGHITEFSIPTSPVPGHDNNHAITAGPDGNIWFTEFWANKIGKITLQGKITEYVVPTPNSVPVSIIAGPDGNVWFTEVNANKTGRMTPAGTFLAEINVPTSNSQPAAITGGPDGNIWFTEDNGNKIGRITTSTASSIPTGTPTLSDPLQDNTKGFQWDEWKTSDQTCGFVPGKYYLLTADANHGIGCNTEAKPQSVFGNSVSQITMTILSGLDNMDSGAGPQFRVDPDNNSWHYKVTFDVRGNWHLWISANDNASILPSSLAGARCGNPCPYFHTGFNQPNVFTIRTVGNKIDVWVNEHLIDSCTDNTYSSGFLGTRLDPGTGSASVAFSNLRVWRL